MFLLLLVLVGVCVCGLHICRSFVYVHACMWNVCIYVYVLMLCLRESEMCVIMVCIFEVVYICVAWM